MEHPPKQNHWLRLAIPFYLLMAVIACIWLSFQAGGLTWNLFVDPKAWLHDLAIGLAAGIALVVFWDLCGWLVPDIRRLAEDLAALLGPLSIGSVLALALLSGIGEELLFRGAMQNAWGWKWSVALFAVLHTGPGHRFRYWTAFALVAGILLSYLTFERGNLFAAITAHATVNGINLWRLSRSFGTNREETEF